MGYTTSACDSRGSFYCSNIGKAFDMPIIHINGDDVEAVHKMGKLVADYK